MQWKIINEVLNHKQDICVVMATGNLKKYYYETHILALLFQQSVKYFSKLINGVINISPCHFV